MEIVEFVSHKDLVVITVGEEYKGEVVYSLKVDRNKLVVVTDRENYFLQLEGGEFIKYSTGCCAKIILPNPSLN